MMINGGGFRAAEATLARSLLDAPMIDRVTWHSQKAPAPTHELPHTRVIMPIPPTQRGAELEVRPNLPWAEDQFLERVSGEPLNPPPSHEWWPYAQKSNAVHTESGGGKFSHTYPERYWPQMANVGETRENGRQVFVPHNGIRFQYGDLGDLIDVLNENPATRQAYLPVWFPEDLTAAKLGERVPCSIGYHFLLTREARLDIDYTIRSCDFIRHFRDDVYMTMRLLHWVLDEVNTRGKQPFLTGQLFMNIGSLHAFEADELSLKKLI